MKRVWGLPVGEGPELDTESNELQREENESNGNIAFCSLARKLDISVLKYSINCLSASQKCWPLVALFSCLPVVPGTDLTLHSVITGPGPSLSLDYLLPVSGDGFVINCTFEAGSVKSTVWRRLALNA